jgi:dihydroneopterin aldolase
MRQKIEVDVELRVPLERPGKDDILEETIDYTAVYSLVEEVVTEKKFKLLEALAHELALRLLSSFPVQEALVRVRKLNVPFAGNTSNVEVEVTRTRK